MLDLLSIALIVAFFAIAAALAKACAKLELEEEQ